MSSSETAYRRHLYLITAHPDDGMVGQVKAVDQRFVHGKKNEERPIQKRNLETGESYVEKLVGLGYYDFDDEEDYENRFPEVARQKLTEIDEEHLEAAGLDPAEIHGDDGGDD